MSKPQSYETRQSTQPVEIRSEGETGEMPTIRGEAILYGVRSVNFNSETRPFYEIIEPGAADGIIYESDIRALVNHEGTPLARTKSGTLKIQNNARALSFEFTPADNPSNRELIQAIERGDLNNCSFRFRAARDRFEEIREDDKICVIRHVEKFSALRDISLVTFAAYEQTSADIKRSIEGWKRDHSINQDHHRRRRTLNLF